MWNARVRCDGKEDGFTLIETLVALVIVAFTVSLAFVNYRERAGVTRLRPLALQVAAQLRSARSSAITGNGLVAFVLDPVARSYHIEGSASVVRLPPDIGAKLTAAAARNVAGGNRLEFYGDGSSNGGTVMLIGRGQTIMLQVEWLTGTVTVRDGAG